MARQSDEHAKSIVVKKKQPLIGLLLEEDGGLVERYFSSEEEARAAVAKLRMQAAPDVAGAWSDLDWEDVIRELDRIRHESPPTPPVEL
jgi:hypothetical protein